MLEIGPAPCSVKNLASHVLALALRTVTTDWMAAYGIRPLLDATLAIHSATGPEIGGPSLNWNFLVLIDPKNGRTSV